MGFSGFPRGTRYTPVPDPLLGPLLEAIEDVAELKCTLRALWHINQKKGHLRCVTAGELLSDRVLLVGLNGGPSSPSEAIRRAMESAVERGTFLATPGRKGSSDGLYFVNDEAGRRAFHKIERGDVDVEGMVLREGTLDGPPPSKPNIFKLYEENIGILTPLLAEEMKDAEASYPGPWIEEAFRIAVGRNKRSWRYIEATLKRWVTEGKGDGESGRYSEKAAATEELVEYLRKRGRLPEHRPKSGIVPDL